MKKVISTVLTMLFSFAMFTNYVFADEAAKNISIDLSSAKIIGSGEGISNTTWTDNGDGSYVFNYRHTSSQCWAETEFALPNISGSDYYAIKLTMRVIEADKDGSYDPWFGIFRNEAHTSADYCWAYHTGFDYTTKCIGDGKYYTYYIPTQLGKGDFHFNWTGETIKKMDFRWFYNASGILNVKSIELIAGPEINEIGYNGLTGVDTQSVPTDISSIELYLSEGITSASVSDSTVKLFNPDNVQVESSAEYVSSEKKLVIHPIGKLAKNRKYTVKLDGVWGVARDTVTALVRHPVIAEFKTEHDIFDVDKVKFVDVSPEEEGVNVTVSNSTETQKNFLIVLTAWDGDKFIKNKITEVSVSGKASKEETLSLKGLEKGNLVELYVIDNESENPKLISDQIYSMYF